MNDSDRPFLTHLEALRRVLMGNALVLAVLFPVGWWAARPLLDAYINYAAPESLRTMYYFAPLEVLVLELKCALLLSVLAGFPVMARQWWGFLAPALYRHERRRMAGTVIFSYLLFLAGTAFSFFSIMPLVMRFAASYAGDSLRPLLGVGDFLSLALSLSLAFGVMFQMPLAVMMLCRFGVVRRETLKKQRPVVVVAVLILSAVLTPPDVLSQVLLALPTLALFELGLWLARDKASNDVSDPDGSDGLDSSDGEGDDGASDPTGDGDGLAEVPVEAGTDYYLRQAKRRRGRRIRRIR